MLSASTSASKGHFHAHEESRPVTGQDGAETAVEIINAKSIRIYNKRNGVG